MKGTIMIMCVTLNQNVQLKSLIIHKFHKQEPKRITDKVGIF